MKTTRSKTWLAVCASVLTATAVFRASADQAATAARPEKSCTGTVASVDPKEHVLSVKGWTMMNKSFNVGANCAYHQLDKNNATVNDLRAGEKVTVSYQVVHGVLIADRGNDRLVLVDPEGRVLWTFPEFEDENGMIRGIVVLALHPHGAWKH